MKLPLFVTKAASPAALPKDILVYNASGNADNSLDHPANDLLVVYQQATTDRLLPRDLFSPLLLARDNDGPNCSSGEVACQNSCIPKGADCCGGTFYCNAGSSCTKDGCCADGSVCDSQKCEGDQEACGTGCMPKGSICCGSSYCGSGSVCSKDNTCSPSSSKPSATVQTAQSDKSTTVKSATSDKPTTSAEPTTSDQPTSTSARPKTTTSDRPTTSDKPSTSTKPTSTVQSTTSQTSTTSDKRTTESVSTTTSLSSTSSSSISTDTSLIVTTTIEQDLAAILQTAIPTSAQTDPEARCFLLSGHASQYTTPSWYTTLPSDLQSYYASATVEPSATAHCTPTNPPSKVASQESALPAPTIGALIGAAAFVAGVVTLLILLARSGKLPWLTRRKAHDIDDTSDGAELIPVREKPKRHLSFEPGPTGGIVAPPQTLPHDSRLYASPPTVPSRAQARAGEGVQVVQYDWPIAPSPVASPGRSSFVPSPASSNARFTPPLAFGAEWRPPKEGPRAF